MVDRAPGPLWRTTLRSRHQLESIDRPRVDQQRRSLLPADAPSTSHTGHPRGACRDKAQRRGPASGHDSRMLTPRPNDTAHCARLVTQSLVRFGRRPGCSGAASDLCSAHHAAEGVPAPPSRADIDPARTGSVVNMPTARSHLSCARTSMTVGCGAKRSARDRCDGLVDGERPGSPESRLGAPRPSGSS
jgi:hypothetical protein